MTEVKYPNVKVKLVGHDGNAFAVIGRVRKAMRNTGLTQEQITEFVDEATSGNYDNVIQTCMKYVEVS